jgi:flagellar hook protein FlgE
MELEDSLGTKAKTTLTWTKTADNTWSVSFGNPTTSDGTSTIGTVSSSPITVTFNSDGTLASTDPASPTLDIGSWSTGAGSSSIALDLGTTGTATGLSQYSSGADTPSVSLEVDQNGIYFGSLTTISIDDQGIVWAAYDNSQTLALYKIPVATFNNADGLTTSGNSIYAATAASGSASLVEAGTDGAGTIKGGELEASTTDTNAQFSTMMASQQAYSAAAQVITTAKSMFETLLSAVR